MSNVSEKIIIGTAQFGMDYGISNQAGKVSAEQIKKILNFAKSQGIQFLDTAPGYKESESALGVANAASLDFSIVTKTPQIPISIKSYKKELMLSVEGSMKKLKTKNIYALLVHRPSDLLGENKEEVWCALNEIKALGIVKKIGVSIYSQDELERILNDFPIEIVQAPVSILDQRLVNSGFLAKLKEKEIEIHARSIFLQGLLLMDSSMVPQKLSHSKPYLERLVEFAKKNSISVRKLAISFAFGLKEIDKIVIGITSETELAQIVDDCKNLITIPWKDFACDDISILNPGSWK